MTKETLFWVSNRKIWKHLFIKIYDPMFTAALFTVAKTRKEPKYPSTDEWIKMCTYLYNGLLISHNKR